MTVAGALAFAPALVVLFARVGAMLMTLPLFGDDAAPGRIRLLIALAMTVALSGLLAPRLPTIPSDAWPLAMLVAVELAKGLALGLLMRIAFHAITIAGSIISLQVGLTSAIIHDASLGGQVPMLARLISLVALLLCLSLGLHHVWIGALVRSYSLFPVGGALVAGDMATAAVRAVADASLLGLSLAAPFLVYGIVFNVALGLATRVAPQVQLFFIVQPLTIALGLALVAALLDTIATGFASGIEDQLRGLWG